MTYTQTYKVRVNDMRTHRKQDGGVSVGNTQVVLEAATVFANTNSPYHWR